MRRFSGRALGAYADDEPNRSDGCHRAGPDREDPRLPLPRAEAGDGVQTVSECRHAVASVTGRTFLDRGHAGCGLPEWTPGRRRRRVSPPYTTLDNSSARSAKRRLTARNRPRLWVAFGRRNISHRFSPGVRWSGSCEARTPLARSTRELDSRESFITSGIQSLRSFDANVSSCPRTRNVSSHIVTPAFSSSFSE